jgi:hypothetical protein
MQTIRRLVAFISVTTIGIASGSAVVGAQESTPAPPGTAEAVAADIAGILTIGHTTVEATTAGGTATANALELGGEPPAEQFGGTQEGLGSKEGALLDTGVTPLGRLAVTPWKAEVVSEEGCNKAYGEAALARAMLIDEDTLTVDVLQSSSRARHCGSESTGTSSSDGAVVNLGGGALTLILLHSGVATGATGESYAASINGDAILSDEQASGACGIEVPGVLGLQCLMVGGGAGGLVDATFASLDVGDGSLTATLSGAKAAPGAAAAAPPAAAGELPTAGDEGSLPRTGGPDLLYGIGLMLAATGAELRRRMRVR